MAGMSDWRISRSKFWSVTSGTWAMAIGLSRRSALDRPRRRGSLRETSFGVESGPGRGGPGWPSIARRRRRARRDRGRPRERAATARNRAAFARRAEPGGHAAAAPAGRGTRLHAFAVGFRDHAAGFPVANRREEAV